MLEGVSFNQLSDRERELVATYSRMLLGRGQPTRPARRKMTSGSVHYLLVPIVLFWPLLLIFQRRVHWFHFCTNSWHMRVQFLYTNCLLREGSVKGRFYILVYGPYFKPPFLLYSQLACGTLSSSKLWRRSTRERHERPTSRSRCWGRTRDRTWVRPAFPPLTNRRASLTVRESNPRPGTKCRWAEQAPIGEGLYKAFKKQWYLLRFHCSFLMYLFLLKCLYFW